MPKRGYSNVQILGLLALFLVIAFGGRYLVGTFLPKQEPRLPYDQRKTAENDQATSTGKTIALYSKNLSDSSDIVSCVEGLKTKVSEDTSDYVKGSVLVVFAKDTPYIQAKKIVEAHGAVIRDENESQGSFVAGRRITAAVTPGEEFNKICLLKRDPSVTYAGLDVYFQIHE